MSTELYIITHKKIGGVQRLDKKIYKVLLVGAYNKMESWGYLRDDSGENNISIKNNNFCELTGIYWMWKNSNVDVVGLCHYRRFFSKSKRIFMPIVEKNIIDALKNSDLILPKREKNVYCGLSAKEFFIEQHGKDVWDECKLVIEKFFPDYETDFTWFENETTGYCFNMFVGKRELLNEYFEWLFTILFELEKKIDLSNMSTYNQRMYGFVAERLINVWVHHKNLRVAEIPVYMIGNSIWKRKIERRLKRIVRIK